MAKALLLLDNASCHKTYQKLDDVDIRVNFLTYKCTLDHSSILLMEQLYFPSEENTTKYPVPLQFTKTPYFENHFSKQVFSKNHDFAKPFTKGNLKRF